MSERLRQIGGGASLRSVLAAGIWLVAIAAVAPARGEPISDERPTKVAVSPNSFRIFGPPDDGDFDYSVGEATRRGATRYLARHDEIVDVVTAAEVRDHLRGRPMYEDTRSEAREWTRYGTENYKQLEVDKAVDQLKNAVESYDKIYYGEVEPERMAEILMYLALSYLNQGNVGTRPLEVMERMVRLDPSRLMREGFYPGRVADFYQTARRDVVRRLQERGPRAERAERLLEWTDAELAVFGGTFRIEEGGGYRVKVYVYSKSQGEFLEPESTRVEAPTAPKLREAANRLMARFAPCIYEPTDDESSNTLVKSPGQSPLSLHLTFAYASFLEYPDPIEKPFGNAGVGIGSKLAITEEFGLGVGLNLLSSFRDFSGRILDNFSTIRVFTGPDIGIGVGPLNLGLSARLEIAHVGGFQLCADETRPPQRGCPDSNRRTYPDLNVLAGFNTRPRVRLNLFETFELVAAGSFSTFLLPASRPLNNPLSAEFGIRYRF